jgi:hypothetical protein
MASRKPTRKKASARKKAKGSRAAAKPKARKAKPKTAKAKPRAGVARKKAARAATPKGAGKNKRESAAKVLPIDPVREALARLRRRQVSL